MAPAPPYIYAAPRATSTFDPKAHTRASFTPRPPAPRRPPGPLIEFNKHPDSYVALPYGQTNVQPLPASTKKVVILSRWLQLVLRFLGLLGAAGALVCVVCLKNVQDSESLVMRIPPAADIVLTSYAVWHLARPARRRTPASSASYHLFACILDVALIPFYIYICLHSRANASLEVSDKLRWGSFWNVEGTDKLFQATFLVTMTTAGLHAAGLVGSVWLTWKFRQIANMPPDMNPLEENLTSRHRTKHQAHMSESSVSTESARDSVISQDSFKRFSVLKQDDPDDQGVSFMGTRNTDAASLYSPHNPRTANASRTSLLSPDHGTLYDRVSRAQQPPSQRPSRLSTMQLAAPHLTSADASSLRPSTAGTDSSYDQHPRVPRKSSKRVSDSNWAVLEDSSSDSDARVEKWRKDYRHLDPLADVDPLAMNPLTPPASFTSPRGLSDASSNRASSPRLGSGAKPKKSYGDLGSETGSIKYGRASPGISSGDWLGTKAPAEGAARVVSRTGVDLTDMPLISYDDWEERHVSGYGGNGRRNVSGKVAEEGNAGGWARRRISGKVLRM